MSARVKTLNYNSALLNIHHGTLTQSVYSIGWEITEKPHADSSYFPPGLSKDEVYTQMIEQARGLIHGQRNWVLFFSIC